jgi:hypothetical protein
MQMEGGEVSCDLLDGVLTLPQEKLVEHGIQEVLGQPQHLHVLALASVHVAVMSSAMVVRDIWSERWVGMSG